MAKGLWQELIGFTFIRLVHLIRDARSHTKAEGAALHCPSPLRHTLPLPRREPSSVAALCVCRSWWRRAWFTSSLGWTCRMRRLCLTAAWKPSRLSGR
jgi:hypothetical protein